ncbi:MAG: hypothetical protein ACYCPQ_01325 [Elusimicrobiota bacterium]
MNIDINKILNKGVSAILEDIQTTTATFRDRGPKHFLRALVAGGSLVIASYIFVYSPANERLALIGRRISQAKAEAEFTDAYKSLSGELTQVYSQIPSNSQRDAWLNETVSDCLKTEGVTADSISPKEDEQRSVHLLRESVTLTAVMSYSQMLAVLNRFEHLRPRVEISSFQLKKTPEAVGKNQVTLEIATLIPTKRFSP